jgi:hypothetical protein
LPTPDLLSTSLKNKYWYTNTDTNLKRHRKRTDLIIHHFPNISLSLLKSDGNNMKNSNKNTEISEAALEAYLHYGVPERK